MLAVASVRPSGENARLEIVPRCSTCAGSSGITAISLPDRASHRLSTNTPRSDKLLRAAATNRPSGENVVAEDQMAVTTFFDIVNGEMKADTGKFEWGTTVTTAYLPNDNSKYFINDLPLMDWLRQYVPSHVTDVDEPFLRGFLGKMLFSGDEILKKTSVLSGGEKVRCMISRMMLQDPNVVILDEPTNHLDLESIQSFNESMINFKGIVLISSHDHTFLQTVANRVIELTPNGTIDKLMSFDEYLDEKHAKKMQLA